jgi:hypothetical protein
MGRKALTLAITAGLLLGLPAAAQGLAPVGPGVVGLWQGEGNATDPFNGHDGTLLGGMGFAPASPGQAFSFTEAEQAVDIPDSSTLYPSGSFTIAGWVRTSDAVNPQVLIGHYECGLFCPTSQASSGLALFVNGGKAEGWIRDADAGGPSEESGQYLPGSTTVANGTNHYLAFERDSGAEELRLYVDGALESSAAPKEVATGPLENLDGEADDFYLGAFRQCGPPIMGCDGTLVNQLSGLLDDAIYWERAVSGGEIAAIYAAGPNGLTTDSALPASTASTPGTASVGTVPVGFTASDLPGPSPHVHDPSGIARVDLYVEGPGESSFTKAASAPGSSEGSFAYTASTSGTYAFSTVATDAAGNVEPLPPSPDAITKVTSAPVKPKVPNFTTAIFQPPDLYLRLKCPARFKPKCLGSAIAMTNRKRGKPMTGPTSASQKANRWRVAHLVVKPQYTDKVAEMAKHPTQKLLIVRQMIHAKRFEHGRPQAVFHIYRVVMATSP